jgi:tripartite-type tricarboxylate transporter receptor subunit TctC
VRLSIPLCLSAFVAAFLAVISQPLAQTTVGSGVRIIVPIAAGGTTDVLARLLADRLQAELGRPVVVDNRPGANGRIAVEALKHAAPDGATLLLTPIAVPVLAPLLFKAIGFDPTADLSPIAQVSTYEFAFAVAAEHPAQSLPEFIEWARKHPEQATFGTVGKGSIPHLLGTVLAKAAGIEFLHVPYRSAALAETDLLGGRLAAELSAESDLTAMYRAGKLRILATSGPQRSRLFPAVPTFRELGFASAEAVGWHAVYAPAGTPKAVIDRWSASIATALQTPELREKLIALGLQPTGTTPEQLAAITASSAAHWRRIIEASGFSVE